MAHQHYRTKGIFLKKEDRGEADQLFTVFTEDFGKLKILGRAIRKIKSKLKAGAELFYFSEVEFIQGKSYKTLTDAILIDKFKNLRSDPKRLSLVYQITDTLDSLCGEEESESKIWKLLNETCAGLNNLQLASYSLQLLYFYFLWKLFLILGYAPELHYCPVCQKKLLPETLFFVPEEGGVICWQCLSKLKKGWEAGQGNGEKRDVVSGRVREISVGTVKVLRIFLKEPIEIVEKLIIDKADKKNLKEISELYLSYLKETINP